MEIGSDAWSALITAGAGAFGVDVTAAQAAQMARHAVQLLAWNRVSNLTTVTEPAAMARTHYLDSLSVAPLVPPAAALLDIGSGGGFPGLPLHIALPGLRTALIDASRKKASFLRHVIRELGLTGILALHRRAEEMAGASGGSPRFGVIVSRALGAVEPFVRMALPLLAPGGRIVAMKGHLEAREIRDFEHAAETGGYGEALRLRCRGYRVPGLASERTLLVFERPGPPDAAC
ncbi:MAG: 16S rRNA (guanine(527)-N(7))-methyltransferase RsmG [Desulfobacterales bacterium]